MDDTLLVGVGEGGRHFARDPERILHGQLMLPRQPAPQRLPLDERHGVVETRRAIGQRESTGVVQRQDVRVTQAGGESDLPQESIWSQRVGELRVQHLERDWAVMLEVVGKIDRGHTATPELALEHIAVTEGFS